MFRHASVASRRLICQPWHLSKRQFAWEKSFKGSAGKVVRVDKGNAQIEGLPDATIGSLVDIACRGGHRQRGLVLSVHERVVCAALMGPGPPTEVQDQDLVQHFGDVPRFPVGPGVIGRVLDVEGNPLDGRGPLPAVKFAPILAGDQPTLIDRAPCKTMVPTGLKLLDAFHPLARGLRVAVMGPRNVGKSTLAVDILAGQAAAAIGLDEVMLSDSETEIEATETETEATHSEGERSELDTASGGAVVTRGSVTEAEVDTDDLIAWDQPQACVYVCVGRSKQECERVVSELAATGALAYTTVICATNSDPLPLQVLAPFAGAAVGGWFRDRGMHALVVFDDLAAHGDAYLALAAGFPGAIDHVSYFHARLLEHSAQLSEHKGGGSSTAVCLVETMNVDRESARGALQQQGISTNSSVVETLASFADHFIYLEPRMSLARLWPPVNCTTVMGRPPPRFQPPATRGLVSSLHAQLMASQQAEQVALLAAEFGLEHERADEDMPIKDFARKLQLLLCQHKGTFLPMSYQFVTLYAATENLLIDVTDADLATGNFEWRLHRFVEEFYPDLLTDLEVADMAQDLPTSLQADLAEAYAEFKAFTREFLLAEHLRRTEAELDPANSGGEPHAV